MRLVQKSTVCKTLPCKWHWIKNTIKWRYLQSIFPCCSVIKLVSKTKYQYRSTSPYHTHTRKTEMRSIFHTLRQHKNNSHNTTNNPNTTAPRSQNNTMASSRHCVHVPQINDTDMGYWMMEPWYQYLLGNFHQLPARILV